MNRQPGKFDDDDGRVICSMDVDGMRRHERSNRRELFVPPQAPSSGQMTRSEARRYAWYAVQAGLLVALVFSAVWVLLTLFCTLVWFR
jgi:hypothetical protein